MTSIREAREVLERRLLHLEKRVDSNERAGRPTSYDKAELSAIRVALREFADKEPRTT